MRRVGGALSARSRQYQGTTAAMSNVPQCRSRRGSFFGHLECAQQMTILSSHVVTPFKIVGIFCASQSACGLLFLARHAESRTHALSMSSVSRTRYRGHSRRRRTFCLPLQDLRIQLDGTKRAAQAGPPPPRWRTVVATMPHQIVCPRCGTCGLVRVEHVIRGEHATRVYDCGGCEYAWTIPDAPVSPAAPPRPKWNSKTRQIGPKRGRHA